MSNVGSRMASRDTCAPRCVRVSPGARLDIRVRYLTPDLRECLQPADLHLQQLVLLRLVGERIAKERLERLAGAQGAAQIDLVIAEQARAEAAVRSQPNAIARLA